jgi:hypothetical protein
MTHPTVTPDTDFFHAPASSGYVTKESEFKGRKLHAEVLADAATSWNVSASIASSAVVGGKPDLNLALQTFVRIAVRSTDFGLTGESVARIKDEELGWHLITWFGVDQIVRRWGITRDGEVESRKNAHSRSSTARRATSTKGSSRAPSSSASSAPASRSRRSEG